MRLTIEITNPNEVEFLLNVFKTLNLQGIKIVLDKQLNQEIEAKNDILKKLNRPIKKQLNIEEIKKAKNYKGVNRERFDKLVKEINIVEPIELLVSQLSQ